MYLQHRHRYLEFASIFRESSLVHDIVLCTRSSYVHDSRSRNYCIPVVACQRHVQLIRFSCKALLRSTLTYSVQLYGCRRDNAVSGVGRSPVAVPSRNCVYVLRRYFIPCTVVLTDYTLQYCTTAVRWYYCSVPNS